jgi:hypothetical protein
MSSTSNSHASEEKVVANSSKARLTHLESQEARFTVPEKVEPITTVLPTESKKKPSSKSATKKKKSSKSKKGEFKIPLAMTDLYLGENQFETTGVKAEVDISVKDSKIVDIEAPAKTGPAATTSESEKGNLAETLVSENPKTAKKLGLEDLNVADNTAGENMDIDSPGTTIETSVAVESVQKSPEKADVRQDVGPDVEISSGQHDK